MDREEKWSDYGIYLSQNILKKHLLKWRVWKEKNEEKLMAQVEALKVFAEWYKVQKWTELENVRYFYEFFKNRKNEFEKQINN